MTDTEKKIAEIRGALEKVTPGRLEFLGDSITWYPIINRVVTADDSKYIARVYDRNYGFIFANALEWFRFFLSEIDRLKRGGWISVKERLPLEEGKYLVYSDWEGYEIGKWTKNGWKVWKFDVFDEELAWDEPLYTITHWQPLPEPPKGG